MAYLRSVFGKKQIILALTGAVSLLLAFVLTIIGISAVKGLDAENLASRWSRDNDFAEVSCFFSQLTGVDENTIRQLNYNIENRLKLDSIKAENENARTWVYAYSANGEASVVFKNYSGSFKAVGVGGDYFLFHPLKLVHGNYFSEGVLADDLVIIDRDVAAQLFGGSDVVGQMLEIGGVPHIICGVIERESGRINDLAGNDKPTIYMSYNALSDHGTITHLNMYEALLPNPIDGYAASVISDNLKVNETSYELVENTGRFRWTKLLANVRNFGIRGMNGKAIVYPYWENVARGMEDYLTPVAVMGFLFYLYPAVLVFLLLLRMWKLRPVHFKDIKGFVDNRVDRHRQKRYEKLQKKEKLREAGSDEV